MNRTGCSYVPEPGSDDDFLDAAADRTDHAMMVDCSSIERSIDLEMSDAPVYRALSVEHLRGACDAPPPQYRSLSAEQPSLLAPPPPPESHQQLGGPPASMSLGYSPVSPDGCSPAAPVYPAAAPGLSAAVYSLSSPSYSPTSPAYGYAPAAAAASFGTTSDAHAFSPMDPSGMPNASSSCGADRHNLASAPAAAQTKPPGVKIHEAWLAQIRAATVKDGVVAGLAEFDAQLLQ